MEISSAPELSLLLSQRYHRRSIHCSKKLHLLMKRKLSTPKHQHSGQTVTDDHIDPSRSYLDLLALATTYVRSVNNQDVLITTSLASVSSFTNVSKAMQIAAIFECDNESDHESPLAK